jgi:hypothetical protein
MSLPDPYQGWMETRRKVPVPGYFPDRVLDAIRSRRASADQVPDVFHRLIVNPYAAAGLLLVVLGAGILRIGVSLVLVLVSPGEGF